MPSEKLLTKQQLEAAVLLAQGVNQSETATTIGVSRQAIHKWLKLPAFQNHIRSLQEVKKNAISSLIAAEQEVYIKDLTEFNSIRAQSYKDNLNKGLKQLENKDSLRERECYYLDLALKTVLPRVEEGDLRAIDRLLKISERRSKLLGLDIKSMSIMDAMGLLLTEGVASAQQAIIVSHTIEKMEQELKLLNQDGNEENEC